MSHLTDETKCLIGAMNLALNYIQTGRIQQAAHTIEQGINDYRSSLPSVAQIAEFDIWDAQFKAASNINTRPALTPITPPTKGR